MPPARPSAGYACGTETSLLARDSAKAASAGGASRRARVVVPLRGLPLRQAHPRHAAPAVHLRVRTRSGARPDNSPCGTSCLVPSVTARNHTPLIDSSARTPSALARKTRGGPYEPPFFFPPAPPSRPTHVINEAALRPSNQAGNRLFHGPATPHCAAPCAKPGAA